MKYILQNRKKGKSKYQNIFQGFYTSAMDQVNVLLTKQNHSASAALKIETKPKQQINIYDIQLCSQS